VRVFVYEFVTGGGLAGEALDRTLVSEADLMVRSLLEDLGNVPDLTCLTTRDPRLAPIQGVETLAGQPDETPFDLFRRGTGMAEWVWPIAPESGGTLERLARLVLESRRGLIGSRPDAIRLTASKLATAVHLAGAGIPVVPSFQVDATDLPADQGPWVVKPDDGAGAEDALVVPDLESARAHLSSRGPTHIMQPWVSGVPASLSLLCHEGKARLLACNRQKIRVTDGRIVLSGIHVNGEKARAVDFAALGERIAAAIPGLWGYVGVDLMVTSHGLMVLEINPRLTTSWCGLPQALSANPARWVVELARTGALPLPPFPSAGGTYHLHLETLGVR
jgi:predicted ATP-grasp superfamily ATP-dependent carboligase